MKKEKDTDRLETPPWLFRQLNERFRFTIDACASRSNALLSTYWTKNDDCLQRNWQRHNVFLNPPYSNPEPFLKKAISAYSCVALVKGDPSTKWWQRRVQDWATVIWLPRRVRFYLDGKPTQFAASFPSALLLYGFTPLEI